MMTIRAYGGLILIHMSLSRIMSETGAGLEPVSSDSHRRECWIIKGMLAEPPQPGARHIRSHSVICPRVYFEVMFLSSVHVSSDPPRSSVLSLYPLCLMWLRYVKGKSDATWCNFSWCSDRKQLCVKSTMSVTVQNRYLFIMTEQRTSARRSAVSV